MLKDEYDKITHEIIGCAMEVHKIFLVRIGCNLKDYSIRNIKFNLGNLENLNKIKVQTSMANGHFGIK